MSKAIKYIYASQRPDGSWFGSWGVCFTYATMFALESLALNGEVYENSGRVQRACTFLLGKQMADGGWSESYEVSLLSTLNCFLQHFYATADCDVQACESGEWVGLDQSTVINTAWAVMALLTAKYPDQEPIKRGCRLIMNRQQPNGEWLWESTVSSSLFICSRSRALTPIEFSVAYSTEALVSTILFSYSFGRHGPSERQQRSLTGRRQGDLAVGMRKV